MLRISIALIFILNNINLTAQKKEKNQKLYIYDVPVKSWHFRINPTHLLDFEPALVLGTEYRVKDRMAVGLDVGYIFNSYFVTEKEGANGFIVKPAIRYYTSHNKRFYVEGEAMYKQVSFKMNDWLGMNCVNDVPAYFELRKFNFLKNVFAFNAKIGRVGALSSKNNSISVDYYTGLGIRYKKFAIDNIPEQSCYETPNGLNVLGEGNGNGILPNFNFGARILIKIGK